MAEKRDLYKCELCGNIVEVLHASGGDLVCCGQAMKHLVPNTVDAAVEKHVPIIEKDGENYTVTVGSTLHPMTDEHYIEFIQLITKARTYTVHLDPGKDPKASFSVHCEVLSARAYCNLHALWKSE
jgi:superoxide reductase